MSQIKATYIDHCGSDLSTVNAARVSFGKKSDWDRKDVYGTDEQGDYEEEVLSLSDKDAKLIKYLAEHKHFSPFGHAFASFHVKAPIFVARQLVKHKFLRWNEISRRYVDDEPEFYLPDAWRGRSEDKKQGSYTPEEQPIEWLGVDVGTYEFCMEAYNRYKWMLDIGIAPEQARMVLPQSTITEWYWSGSLDAFADMAKLRCKDDTQYETRLVADQISEKMKELFPVSWGALLKP
jgi:thymidylate synthase (FAD)